MGVTRLFVPKDARLLTEDHEDIREKLTEIREFPGHCKKRIMHAVDEMVDKEVMDQLRTVPVEEIGRYRKGLRLKLLRDYGYETIADLVGASVMRISSIYGIGEDSARTIYNVVQHIVGNTRNTTKIHLSLDDRSDEATKLVKATTKYRLSRPYAKDASSLVSDYDEYVCQAINDLHRGTSGFRWFFSSSLKKQAANDAYVYLYQLMTSYYANKAYELYDAIESIEQIKGGRAWSSFADDPIGYFNIIEKICPGVLGNDDAVYGLPEALAAEVEDQEFHLEGLLCTLRRYQEWGVKYILHQERVLLGDEMGLGKTIEAIATMVSLRNDGATHFLVVCPASVIINWRREIVKHSLLPVSVIHGPGRQSELNTWKQFGGVAVTTYETTGSIHLDYDFTFSLLVVDEAHYVKNPSAKRTANVKALSNHAERLLFMTGTALENNVNEMISLIQMLQPKIAQQIGNMAYLVTAPQFREKIAPVYYRRKREDVLTELPELIEIQEWCTLNKREEEVYEQAVLSRNYMASRRVSWDVDDLEFSSKAQRLLELIDEAAEDGRKIIVYSYFLDTIRKVCDLLEGRCTSPINGSVSPNRRLEIIDEFDKAPAGTVLPAQIMAGGTGLNIQTASVIIICEPQFKPSTENQAISRAYRMGQVRNVLVYRLLCEDTVDERITDRLEQKQRIFDAYADKSVAAQESIELDDSTFDSIIEEEIERITAKYNED